MMLDSTSGAFSALLLKIASESCLSHFAGMPTLPTSGSALEFQANRETVESKPIDWVVQSREMRDLNLARRQ